VYIYVYNVIVRVKNTSGAGIRFFFSRMRRVSKYTTAGGMINIYPIFIVCRRRVCRV